MSPALRVAARVLGVVFIAAAFLQWVTFDYPDVNPFWPGAIFVPGMLSQLFNWLLVCILGAIGLALFNFGKGRPAAEK